MPTTSPHIQRSVTFPVTATPTLQASRITRVRAWNVCVTVDRRGRLGDTKHLHQWLGREFGVGLQERPEWPLVTRTVRDYRRARAKASGPLRFKQAHRVKTVPVVDKLMDTVVIPGVQARGFAASLVLGARLRYHGDQVTAQVILERPATMDPLINRMKRLKKSSSAEEIGIAVAPDGLYIKVATQRKNNRPKFYHIAATHVTAPGFPQALYQRLIQARAHTVALDLSMASSLSPDLQHASKRLVRWLRSRKAAGAIVTGVASPIPGEVRNTLAFAGASGLRSRRLLRREVILECPHCGASTAVKLDPKTLSPAPGAPACVRCGARSHVGYFLASRASAYVQHDWTEWGAQSPLASDRSAAPHTTTTTETTSKKRHQHPTKPTSTSQTSRA